MLIQRTFSTIVLALLIPGAAPALAQVDQAPSPKFAWVPILIAFVLALGVLVASIMGSRREHRD